MHRQCALKDPGAFFGMAMLDRPNESDREHSPQHWARRLNVDGRMIWRHCILCSIDSATPAVHRTRVPTIPNFPQKFNDEHHAWHTSSHAGFPPRKFQQGAAGSGEEFLTFHRDFMSKVLVWYLDQQGADPSAVARWTAVPAELKNPTYRWSAQLAAEEARLAAPSGQFATSDELGIFIEMGIHNQFLHAATAAHFGEPVVASFHSPSSTYFYKIHGLVQHWWIQWLAPRFALQTATALPETPSDYSFCIGPNRDLFAIKRAGTGTGTTEVHILSAASGYQQFSMQTGTALQETPAGFDFGIGSNGDIFAIQRVGTGSGTTEVHILSAASGYQQFSLQTGTALQETPSGFDFGIGSNGDIFAIQRVGTGSGTTEVHILSAASGYQQFSLQTGTALQETPSGFAFGIGPNGDIFAIQRIGTGTGTTEAHVLSAASGYQQFSLQTGTALHETPSGFDFGVGANGDVFAIQRWATGSGTTEVHVLQL